MVDDRDSTTTGKVDASPSVYPGTAEPEREPRRGGSSHITSGSFAAWDFSGHGLGPRAARGRVGPLRRSGSRVAPTPASNSPGFDRGYDTVVHGTAGSRLALRVSARFDGC